MLVNRTILGIVCIVATFIARIIYPHAYVTKYFEGRKVKSKLAAIFFWIFGTGWHGLARCGTVFTGRMRPWR